MQMMIQPMDIQYFTTAWFWVTTLGILAAAGLYLWFKVRRRPTYPAWQD